MGVQKMSDRTKVLDAITESGSSGIKEREIAVNTNLKVYQVRRHLRTLFKSRLIFRSLAENKWKLAEFKTDTDEDYNTKMEWNAS